MSSRYLEADAQSLNRRCSSLFKLYRVLGGQKMARIRTSLVRTIDDYQLKVDCYEPFVRDRIEHILIINSGAGIPQTFYEAFATWVADHGFSVFTYDYRGIGGSRGASLKGLRASIEDWGSKDCAAVISHARSLYGAAKLYVLGHSIGSVVTGFVSHAPKIERMLMLSPHTGYFGDYARERKWRMFTMWHIFMPILSRAVGYFPGRRFGLPEDLPYAVAMEWGGRRSIRSLRSDGDVGEFARIVTRALVLRPADDPFATKSAYDRIRARFSNVYFIDRNLYANHYIGHFDFFRRHYRESLWVIALQWLALGEITLNGG